MSFMGVKVVLSLIGVGGAGVVSLMAVKLFVFVLMLAVEVFTVDVDGTVVVLFLIVVDDWLKGVGLKMN